MSNTKWAVPNNPTGTPVLATELASLVDGSYCAPGASYNNSANLDLKADFTILLKFANTTPAAGSAVAELYGLPSIDGTNYASVDGNNQPQMDTFLGTVECRAPSNSSPEVLVLTGLPLSPRKYKFVLKNVSGQTWAGSQSSVNIAPYQLQNV